MHVIFDELAYIVKLIIDKFFLLVYINYVYSMSNIKYMSLCLNCLWLAVIIKFL